jgi:transcriptional regulator with XRE-family HTH domain
MEISDERKAVVAYVRERLKAECEERGAQARVAEELGVSETHISNVVNNKVGLGDEFLRAVARRWEMTYHRMEERALAAQQPITEDEALRLPNRAEAMRIARKSGEMDSEMIVKFVADTETIIRDLSLLDWLETLIGWMKLRTLPRRRAPVRRRRSKRV